MTLEATLDDGALTVPAPFRRLLGISPEHLVEFRVSGEGRSIESTTRIDADGRLSLNKDAPGGSVLLTIWAAEGRAVEGRVEGRVGPAESSTDALHRLAMELDPAGTGIGVRELSTAAADRGLLTGRSDAYRHVYSLLNYAKDRFARSGKGQFRWTEVTDEHRAGLGGKGLIRAAVAWAEQHDVNNQGVHYQDIVRGLEAAGTPVKGPDRGRTVYSNLVGPVGARSFERLGAGVFRRKVPGGT